MGLRHRRLDWGLQHCAFGTSAVAHFPARFRIPGQPLQNLASCQRNHTENVPAPGCHNRNRQRPAVRELPQPLPALHLHTRECRANVAGRGRLPLETWLLLFASASSENAGASHPIPALGMESRCHVRPQDQFPASYHRHELQNEPHFSYQVRCLAPTLSWTIRPIVVRH